MGSSGQGLAEMGIIQIPLHGLVAQESWVQIPLCHLPVRGKVSTSMSLFFFLKKKMSITLLGTPQRLLEELNTVFQVKCSAQDLIKSECLINNISHFTWNRNFSSTEHVLPLSTSLVLESRLVFPWLEARVKLKILNNLCCPGLASEL